MPRHLSNLPSSRRLSLLLLLLLLLLPHTALLTSHNVAQDCFEYCLMCRQDNSNHRTPEAPLKQSLVVSLQVGPNGSLPFAHIIIKGSTPVTSIMVNEEDVTVWVGNKPHETLTLAAPRTPFSWVSLALTRASPHTLLVHQPEDKLNVMVLHTEAGPSVFVSSNNETHVAFNCLSGCLVWESSAAIKTRKLRPPFTFYVEPQSNESTSIELSSDIATNVTTTTTTSTTIANLTTYSWTPLQWHRVLVILKQASHAQEQSDMAGMAEDGVMEVRRLLPLQNYTFTRLEGCRWTLHCYPAALNQSIMTQDHNRSSTSTSTPTGDAEGNEGGDIGKEEKGKPHGRKGAGAEEVVAWVLAGLALALVMVLGVALCTKTATQELSLDTQDFSPSVGVVSYKDVGNREPEEDSEPETPTLGPPKHCNNLKGQQVTFNAEDG